MASQLYNYTPTELQKLLDESNSYKDLLKKLNMCDHGSNYITLRKVIAEYNLDLTKISENRMQNNYSQIKKIHQKKPLDEILVEDSTYTNGTNLKSRLFSAGLKEHKCEHCGLTEWLGKPIPLEIHHKNGIHNDNRLENLELICPNCHAFTDTYAGKNIDHKKQKKKEKSTKEPALRGISEDGQRLYDGYGNYKVLCPVCKTNFASKDSKYGMCRQCYDKERLKPKVSKEELFKIMETNSYRSAAKLLGVDKDTVSRWHKYYTNKERENGEMIIGSDKAPSRDVLKTKIRTMSFVQIGKEYGVTDNSVKKWCDAYKLPRLMSEIKSISEEEWKKI